MIKQNYLVNKAYDRLEKGKYEEALSWMKKAQEENPETPDIYAFLGEMYIFNDEFEKAQEAFQTREDLRTKALDQSSSSFGKVLRKWILRQEIFDEYALYIKAYQARILFEQGHWEEAEKIFRDPEIQSIQDYQALYSFALLHQTKGDRLAAYQTMSEIEAQEPAFYYQQIQHLRKKWKKVKNRLAKVQENSPEETLER